MAWAVWWALVLGFAISAIVQAWVPRERIQQALGGGGFRPIAVATGLGPPPPKARWTRSRGTQAWTIAEIAKPNTKAHHTAQAIRKAFERPCQTVSRMLLRLLSP